MGSMGGSRCLEVARVQALLCGGGSSGGSSGISSRQLLINLLFRRGRVLLWSLVVLVIGVLIAQALHELGRILLSNV